MASRSGLFPPEAEADVAHAAGIFGVGEFLFEHRQCFDEVDRVVPVFFNAGADGEDVRVEDDVFGRESHLLGQNLIGPGADVDFAGLGVGLALLVEGHDDDRRAEAPDLPGVGQEALLPLLEADRVDDGLALDAPQARQDDTELRAVDHHRDPADVGFAGHQVEEGVHLGGRVEQRLVEVDVDDLGAVLHLFPGDLEGLDVLLFDDEPAELAAAGDVGPLAGVDEQAVVGDEARFQTRQPELVAVFGDFSGRVGRHGLGDLPDVFGRGAAAPADNVDQSRPGKLPQNPGHELGGVVVAAQLVGQPGVGVDRHGNLGDPGQVGHVGPEEVGAQGAVEAYADGVGVAEAVPEGLGGLPRQGAARGVGDGPRKHDGQVVAGGLVVLEHRVYGGLGVEGVEHGLDEDEVGAAFGKAPDGVAVVVDQGVEAGGPVARVVHVGGEGEGLARRPQYPGDPARLVGGLGRPGVGHPAGELGPLPVEFKHQVAGAVVVLAGLGRVEGVGFQNVGSGGQVAVVDAADHVGPGEGQQVVVALEVLHVGLEPVDPEVSLGEGVFLDLGPHGSVEDEDALGEGSPEQGNTLGSIHRRQFVRNGGSREGGRFKAYKFRPIDSLHTSIRV